MTRDEWKNLAERCEKAAGPDREIDGALYDALAGDGSIIAEHLAKLKLLTLEWMPRYTDNLGAINALIERELPGVPGDAGIGALAHGETKYHAVLYVGGDDSSHCGDAATPELSACAAFCRAMAAKEPTT